MFITHEHADHYLGLASFLQAYHGKTAAYPHVYCQELVKLFLDMQGICSTSVHVIDAQRPQYAQITQFADITVLPVATDHSPTSVAYYFWLPSKQKILFESGDLRPISIEQHVQNIRQLTQTPVSAFLVHEATFMDEQEEALKRLHSTS